MGYGDDLLWIRDAEQQHGTVTPTRKKRPIPHRASEGLWKHLAFVQTKGKPVDELQHKDERWARWYQFTGWRPTPPRTPITDICRGSDWDLVHDIESRHEKFVLLCPDPKGEGSHHDVNKTWYHWQALADQLRDYDWDLVRLTHEETPTAYKGVHTYTTDNIRSSLTVVARADAVVTTDGFWHHASAYTGTDCVVIWGSCTDYRRLGYDTQANIYDYERHGPCYTVHRQCQDCVATMWRITAKTVANALINIKGLNDDT